MFFPSCAPQPPYRVQRALLRWPILCVVAVILFVELLGYLILRVGFKVYELTSGTLRRNKALKRRMHSAREFPEWVAAARKLDQAEGNNQWKDEVESPFFNSVLIEARLGDLNRKRQEEDVRGLMKILTQIYNSPGIGGIDNSQLYTAVRGFVSALPFLFRICMLYLAHICAG